MASDVYDRLDAAIQAAVQRTIVEFSPEYLRAQTNTYRYFDLDNNTRIEGPVETEQLYVHGLKKSLSAMPFLEQGLKAACAEAYQGNTAAQKGMTPNMDIYKHENQLVRYVAAAPFAYNTIEAGALAAGVFTGTREQVIALATETVAEDGTVIERKISDAERDTLLDKLEDFQRAYVEKIGETFRNDASLAQHVLSGPTLENLGQLDYQATCNVVLPLEKPGVQV